MQVASQAGMSIAAVRVLRLALGTALALWFSQVAAWELSFVAPVFTIVILSLPRPVLAFGNGIKFVLVLSLAIYAGLVLLPLLIYQPAVGVLLLALALFWSFYFAATGGSPVLATFVTIGLALMTAIGTESVDGFLGLAKGVSINALIGIVFVWLAFAILPDSMAHDMKQDAGRASPSAAPPSDFAMARRSALRSLAIVLPVCLWLLLSSGSAAFAPVMIKVASMGQQATAAGARQASRSLLWSTVIGGIGAIIAWQILRLWPSLLMYTLLVGLAGLIIAPRIFKDQGSSPEGPTWSYGYLTLIVILAPAVLDGMGGSSADVRFWERMVMFAGATLYGVVAVYVFDAFWPERCRDARTSAD